MRGVLVETIANRFMAGQSISALALDYGAPCCEIEAAIRFQCWYQVDGRYEYAGHTLEDELPLSDKRVGQKRT